ADVLLDRAPPGIYDDIENLCCNVPGVLECKRVRARASGPYMFLDVVITVEEDTSIDEGHHIADAVERALSGLSQRVDVVVHVEPKSPDDMVPSESSVYDLIYTEANRWPEIRGIHEVRIHFMSNEIYIAADLEMQPELTLGKAHDISDLLEKSLAKRLPNLKRVTFHLEADSSKMSISDITEQRSGMVAEIKNLVESKTAATDAHGIVITEDGTGMTVSLDCRLDPEVSLTDSHDVAEDVESAIKRAFSNIKQVFVHIEPE
ncbi:MAG: cation transporter dimerization domain-containing protein, partial [Candidatus Thorarchaeota archaeon]